MAKNCTTVLGTPSLSTSFSVQEAMLTHAHATVEGRNAEKLQSEIETNVIYCKSEETLSSGWNSCRVGRGGTHRHHL